MDVGFACVCVCVQFSGIKYICTVVQPSLDLGFCCQMCVEEAASRGESECKVRERALGIKEEMKNANRQVYRGKWYIRKFGFL